MAACLYDVGERITVLHEAGKPRDAQIQSFHSLYFLPLVMAFIGAGFVMFTVVGFRQLKEGEQGMVRLGPTGEPMEPAP